MKNNTISRVLINSDNESTIKEKLQQMFAWFTRVLSPTTCAKNCQFTFNRLECRSKILIYTVINSILNILFSFNVFDVIIRIVTFSFI